MDSNAFFVGIWVRTLFAGPQLRVIHSLLFHGRDANPNGGIDTFHSVSNANTVVDHAIPFVPDIFSPTLNWVVSSRVRAALSSLDCIVWRPVSFRRVFWMDLEQTSLDWYRNNRGQSEDVIFDLPEAAQRDKFITVPYYELIAVSAWDVIPGCRDRDPTVLWLGKDRRKIEVPSGLKDMIHLPLFTAGRVTFIREEVFASISHFLDDRFFETCRVDLCQVV